MNTRDKILEEIKLMNKEFKLSEKIMYSEIGGYDGEIAVQDVKEFIRLLKENLCNFNKRDLEINLKIIDKLAGSKLTGEKKE
jgi:hypothetical protein